VLLLLRQPAPLLLQDHRIHVIRSLETPKMATGTLQDTIIPPMTPELVDLPHIKAWVPPAIPPHQGTVANILPSTAPLAPKVTPAPALGVLGPAPTTTTPARVPLPAGALLDNTTRTLDPMQTLKCTAEGGTEQEGIHPGQAIQADLQSLPQVRRDSQLRQTTSSVDSQDSIQEINSRREELDPKVPLDQDPDPQVLEDPPDLE